MGELGAQINVGFNSFFCQITHYTDTLLIMNMHKVSCAKKKKYI